MPSKSRKQHDLMEAVKHNPKFARKVGIPQSVGADFVAADKRSGRFARGGIIHQMVQVRKLPDSHVPPVPDIVSQADHTIRGAGRRLDALTGKRRNAKQTT